MLGVKYTAQITLNRFLSPGRENSSPNHNCPLTPLQLTYMSIDAIIKEAVDSEKLHIFGGLDSDEARRTLLLHPQIVTDMEAVLDQNKRLGRLISDFDNFCIGNEITISLTPYEHRDAYMGLLDPEEDGFFDIRSRDPNPGIRVFGRFVKPDTFVALEWWPRSVDMGGKKKLGERNSQEYHFALIEAGQRWDATLPNVRPVTGGQVSDFLTFKAHSV